MRFHRLLLVLVLVVGLSPALSIADQHAYESAADLSASDILSPELLRSDHHEVDDRVLSDGYLNYYTIKSDFGEFEAAGTYLLETRVGEIEALAALNDLSKTKVFATAAKDAGIAQLRTVQEFATRPISTIVGIPQGIGRMFGRYTRKTKETAADVAETASDLVSSDDEDEAGASDDDESTASKAAGAAVGLTESYLGVGGAQRNWARKLGTDPYSSNETLQAAIKEYAWAERLGSFGMGFAGIPSIPGANIIADVNEAVWSKDPWELADLNRERLQATGASEELIEIYLDNGRMTPTQQTMLTATIAELDGVEGRDGILRQSLQPNGETEINFFIQSVAILAWYHINKAPLASVETYATVPVANAENGDAVLAFAVDHLYFTETIAAVGGAHADWKSPDQAAGVWLLGTASERSKSELTAMGFDVHEDTRAAMYDK
ncbi:MAG: hypothetical protein AAFM91_13675 [Pseudomonadota bacterium]